MSLNDIISTGSTDISDVKDQQISRYFDEGRDVVYHRLETYFIHGFKYSKKNWPNMTKRDPYLLTIKGLKARHVPSVVLKAFYLHATQMGSIKITALGNLLRNYMCREAIKVLGIVKPLKIIIDNWEDNRTEYVCKTINPVCGSTMSLCPMTKTVYIDKRDYGIDRDMVTVGRTCRLKYGPYIKFTDVDIDETGPCLVHADQLRSGYTKKHIPWISSEWGREPVKVIYYMYNWFYTGQNTLLSPNISTGYIEQSVFHDLTQVYQIERNGYYIYDDILSQKHHMPVFICISRI